MLELLPGGTQNRDAEIDHAALYASQDQARDLGLIGHTAFMAEGLEFVSTQNTTGGAASEYVPGLTYVSSTMLGIDLPAVAEQQEEAREAGVVPNSAAYFEKLAGERLSLLSGLPVELKLGHIGVTRSGWSDQVRHNYGGQIAYPLPQAQVARPAVREFALPEAA